MGLALRTADGMLLDVPARLSAPSTYVILEQERWFETEIDFVCAWLSSQMTAVDIGAQIGVYALPMARRARRVFAYESDGDARGHLAQGRIHNHVANLDIAGGIAALDEEDTRRGWSPDFVRIGEAHHEGILEGGKRFFDKHSPLVMFQLNGSEEHKTGLVRAVEAMGYRTFRALPRAPQLVLRDSGQPVDALERNIFAAKKDRAAKLNSRGFIASGARDWRPDSDAHARGVDFLRRQRFAAPFASLGVANRAYADALGGHEVWRASKNAVGLMFAFRTLSALCKVSPTIPRLSTLARVAYEAGKRAEALAALCSAQRSLTAGATVEEMFWPAHPRFDELATDASSWTGWLVASIIETIERSQHASSYWGPSGVNLGWLTGVPWSSTEMERRRVLRALKDGKPVALPDRLTYAAADHLNAEVWASGAVERAAG